MGKRGINVNIVKQNKKNTKLQRAKRTKRYPNDPRDPSLLCFSLEFRFCGRTENCTYLTDGKLEWVREWESIAWQQGKLDKMQSSSLIDVLPPPPYIQFWKKKNPVYKL